MKHHADVKLAELEIDLVDESGSVHLQHLLQDVYIEIGDAYQCDGFAKFLELSEVCSLDTLVEDHTFAMQL